MANSMVQNSNNDDLPSNFSKLINLRHLELPYVTKIPKHIGKLENLRALPYFFVEKQKGYDLKELEKLNHLQGKIYIEGLGNVIDPTDAVTANLKDKKYLEELHMNFCDRIEEMDESIVESNVSVLEALQPNRNLNCEICSLLPPLGQLPFLKELRISDCNVIKIIGKEFYGNNSIIVPFRSLEVLKFEQLENWEEWLFIEEFPLLKELEIRNCPKLKRALPQHLPSLEKLKIVCCKELEASIPKGDNIIDLHLVGCESILVNELPTSLKKLVLWESRYIKFSLEQTFLNNTNLEELEFDFRGFVQCCSLDLLNISLRILSLKGWRSSSFPFALHLFTNLHSLYLSDCTELESFPRGGLPSHLRNLVIWNCPKLIASREEWGLFQLNSLTSLNIRDHDFENVESFPEENLLPPTLPTLQLNNCSNLRIMNYKGFLHLKSLKGLSIHNCPSLERLPEEGLRSSLSSLYVTDCPLIKQQYRRDEGERWHLMTLGHALLLA
ncbi:putative disease resistance protein At3g14460 [Medicago truncatula]|uniref:putative disease resistance protein At3g14460 n=1 Tax=Medicago truncatula TaxID=3880 RepID=UPI000D2F46C8|nr:putative disease resistance protein At3g14460 [Medicago truncatula]